MDVFEIILIGIALSIDACALTIANCTACKNKLTKKAEWAMPICFSLFQGLMPLLGYLIGYLLKDYIGTIAQYISAGIFLVLSIKIIVDIIKEKIQENKVVEVCEIAPKNKLSIWIILLQAVATSIDAFAVGITFISLAFSVFIAVLIVAVITFAFVTLALYFGKAVGKAFGGYAEWVGAIILLGLAVKTLIEALA